MSVIAMTCDTCKEDVTIPSEKFELRINPGKQARFAYMCPNCTLCVELPASEENVEFLRKANVREVVLPDTSKKPRPERIPTHIKKKAPITYNDILDFHIYLENCAPQEEDWFKSEYIKVLQKRNAK